MIYLIYLILVPSSLLLTLIAVILAPVMILFKVEKLWWCDNHNYQAVGPVLPSWLNWFNTPDNTLDGTTQQQLILHIHYKDMLYTHTEKMIPYSTTPAYKVMCASIATKTLARILNLYVRCDSNLSTIKL